MKQDPCSFALQPSQRLPKSKLNQMTVRIANGREVADHAAYIGGRINEHVPLPREISNAINFLARITLKPEMIETRFDLILDHDQDKQWILARLGHRTKPDIMSPFTSAIAHDREATDGRVKVD
jgi:hypothetical protein